MRRCILTAIILLCFTMALNAQMPDIKQVVTKFYTTYSLPENYGSPAFEKRKNEWRINLRKSENQEWDKGISFVFYDGKKGDYLPLDLEASNMDSMQEFYYNDYISEYDIYSYGLHDYYGYDGWYNDVIKEYSTIADLSDDNLYSLGRAYSTAATALLGDDQFGDANVTTENRDITKKLSALKIEKYRDIEHLSQAAFLRLKKQNPGFNTIVGNIDIKYANEKMTEVHNMIVYAQKPVLIDLSEKLYNDSIVKLAKATLSKCPPNAIYISYGDNDFYPILYAQYKLKYRQDVYLINKSLLGLDRFIYRIMQPQLHAGAIKISADTSLYNNYKNSYVRIDKTLKPQTVKQLLSSLKDNKVYMPSVSGSINIPRINKPVIKLQLTGYTLFVNDWILLDIISNLNGRALCFAYEPDDFSDLNKYTVKKSKFCYQLK